MSCEMIHRGSHEIALLLFLFFYFQNATEISNNSMSNLLMIFCTQQQRSVFFQQLAVLLGVCYLLLAATDSVCVFQVIALV